MSPSEPAHHDDRAVRSIFHININCSDLDRSVAFYRRLGFEVVMDAGTVSGIADGSYEALEIHGTYRHRGPVVMFLGTDRYQTRLDLMQWEQPPSPPNADRPPTALGIPRIALWTKDLRGLHRRLADEGVAFITEPRGPFEDRSIEAIVGLRDPDGLIVELMEFLPGGRKLYSSADEAQSAH
jgi:catechol 2,3-dioxygenase-like lactoylglutathione lyase family enzyme